MKKIVVAALALSSFACTYDIGVGHTKVQKIEPAPGPANKPLDILFVVDNSASMVEEQQNLARTIYKEECPISDLTQVPEALLNPEPGVLEDLAKVCGFSQILAAYDRDFRVGVITTDVDACDNVIPEQMGGFDRGFHPQRGCLQPVPSTGQKVIARDDVDVAGKFAQLIANVGTFGSPFERGLDAADAFLAGDFLDESCAFDRDDFLRDDAQLLIIFVSDEDDCSHQDGAFGFDDETGRVCGSDPDVLAGHATPGDCYSEPDLLAPTSLFIDRFTAVKADPTDVSVAVIAGSVDVGGELVAAGCIADSGGVPLSSCTASGGLSNFTGPGEPCDATQMTCCTADPAKRYFELAGQLPFTGGSICSPKYENTLITATQKTENDG